MKHLESRKHFGDIANGYCHDSFVTSLQHEGYLRSLVINIFWLKLFFLPVNWGRWSTPLKFIKKANKLILKPFLNLVWWKHPFACSTYLDVESAQSASRNVLGMVISPQLCGICLYYRDSWTLLYVSGVSDLRWYWSVCQTKWLMVWRLHVLLQRSLSTLSSHVIYWIMKCRTINTQTSHFFSFFTWLQIWFRSSITGLKLVISLLFYFYTFNAN